MEQENKQNIQQENNESNDNLVDKVGNTNIHPVSDMDEADDNAKVVAPADLGDGDEKDEFDDK